MTTQLDLFGKHAEPPSVLPAKRRMAETSLAAYDRGTAAQQRYRVLKAVELAGEHGITVDELAEQAEARDAEQGV